MIHNDYHGWFIENYHHDMCSMPEDVSNNFVLHKFTSPGTGNFRGVLYNDTNIRDKIPLNVLVVTKFESISVSIMLKTRMEVTEYCTVFNFVTPRPHECVSFIILPQSPV